MVLFGVLAVYTIDRWYLVRGRGGEYFFGWPEKFTYYILRPPIPPPFRLFCPNAPLTIKIGLSNKHLYIRS